MRCPNAIAVLVLVTVGCATAGSRDDTSANPVDAGALADGALGPVFVDGAAPDAAAPCVEGEARVENGDTCFLYFADRKSWNNARAHCSLIGGELARVGDATQQGLVASIVPTFDDSDAWLAGTDAADEGLWRWADGPLLSFVNWRSGEPNDGAGGEDCMVIEGDRGGSWDDRGCDEEYAFVCSRPL